MFRRPFLAAAAAAALVLVPTAASAYVAPGFDFVATDPTPAAGQAFTVTVDGTTAGESYTLAVSTDDVIVSGAVEGPATKTATASSVSWSVRLSEEGDYRLAVTDESGALVSDLTVSVSGTAASRGGGAGGRTAADSDDDAADLADTGFDGMGMALGAGGLLVVGAGAVLLARRRQGDHTRV